MKEPKPLRECNYRTVRKRLAKALGVVEAQNVGGGSGLYMYHYGSYIRVRLYKDWEPIFEEDCPREGFPSDELITKLMLIA